MNYDIININYYTSYYIIVEYCLLILNIGYLNFLCIFYTLTAKLYKFISVKLIGKEG